jgi:hypothetical protein
MVLFPVDRPHHERAMERVRAALDEDALAAAWGQGERMGYEEALGWVLARAED